MTQTITGPSGTITPTLISGYTSARPSKNIVHQIPDSDDVVITLGDAGPRTGTMLLIFGQSEANANAAEAILKVAQVFTLADTVTATIDMTFVVTETLVRQISQDGAVVWSVQFGYQETL